MDSSASAPDQSFHVRSISLPSRPHPAAVKAEEDLQTLKAAASSLLSAADICSALRGAGDLYSSVEELLSLPSLRQTVLGSASAQKRRVEEELESSVALLDLVDVSKDLLAAMNEHVRGLRSAVRRRGGKKISQEKEHLQQFRLRKEMGKSMSKCGKALKRMGERCGSFAPLERDTDLALAVGVLAESRDATLSVLAAVLQLLSPRKPRGGRWGFVLKAIRKNKVACENAQQMEKDLSLCSSYECVVSKEVDGEMMLRAQGELSRAEVAIGALEHELQSLLRRLIQCRVSFLNMLSLG